MKCIFFRLTDRNTHTDGGGRDFLFGDGRLIKSHPVPERRGLGKTSI